MKRKYGVILVCSIVVCVFIGCGKKENSINNKVETQSNEKSNPETDITDNDNTMYINGEADYPKDYTTVDSLMEDACALVKVKVVQNKSDHVRSYVYTSYEAEILNVVYGEVGNIGDVLNINMPGGTIEGESAQEMLNEVTEGKNSGDLSEINNIVSNAGTDRLLQNGDEAYLFIRKESDESYAAVGEYRGEFLLENGMVLFDENIKGFSEDIGLYSLEGNVSEEDFIAAISEMKK